MSEIVAVPSPSAAIPGADGDALSALDLSTSAVTALIEEAELTPKPALVDRRGNGAHHDLDLERLRLSAGALRDGFAAIARAASGAEPSLRLREQLGRIGREMERRMLAATDGSNAHRGAIWALGLLVAAAAQRRSESHPASIAATAAALARLPDRFAPRPLSNGERARLRFGATGARGEAQAGFPHAILVGLPTLRAARGRGVLEDCARLDALMAIMASLDDTCLLHRGGRAALQAAKAGAWAVLAEGGTASPAGLQRLHRLHDELMRLWASPGGSADLLSVTLFLDLLEVCQVFQPDVAESQAGKPDLQQESFHGNPELRV
ncbi:MAG: triphosphoribosyl-dephospho-CoA synthase [Isosphaeraceae bacterium]